MTTGQVLAAVAIITAACVVLAAIVIVWAVRVDRRDRATAHAYEQGWADCLSAAVDLYAPSVDHPDERLLWAAALASLEVNPYREATP